MGRNQVRSEASQRRHLKKASDKSRWANLARSGRDADDRRRGRAARRMALMVVLLLGLLVIAYLRARM